MANPELVTIDVADIQILDDRVRKKPGDIRGLAKSLAAQGQISPIYLDGNTLIAGWRRVMAVHLLETEGQNIKGLEPGQILATRSLDALDPLERILAEYEENYHRKEFEKAEEAIAIAKIKVRLEDATERKWTTRQLAEHLGYSTGNVSMALVVDEAVKKGDKSLLEASSISAAYRELQNKKKLKEVKDRITKAKARGEVDSDRYQHLHNTDGLAYIRSLPDESVDFVHLDPPWGIGVDSYDRLHNYGTFADDADLARTMADVLVPESYRVLAPDSFMVLWFGSQFYAELYQRMVEAGFSVYPVPFIWHKPNKSGAQNDPYRTVMNTYEPFFLAAKGDPRFFKTPQTNFLSYPMPERNARIHYAQKPVDLCVDILERFSFGPAKILDPTFGSGSIMVAGQRLGRTLMGCEKDKTNYDNAISWLTNAQLAE